MAQLTVLLLAYHPRPYLEACIHSAAAQSPDAGSYDIEVVTGYDPPALPGGTAERPVLGRIDPEPALGRWLVRAIATVRSPLIAFLEDDDLFESTHLARAQRVFRESPEVVYYRSRLSVMDAAGAPLPRGAWSRLEVDEPLGRGPVQVAPGSGGAGVERLRRLGVHWLNLSTAVVRREIFTPELCAAIEECGSPDLCVFVAGLLYGGGLYFDDARTTRYRHQSESLSRSQPWRRQHASDHRRLAQLAELKGARALARWLDDRGGMLERGVAAGEVIDGIRQAAPPPDLRARFHKYAWGLRQDPVLAPPLVVRWGTAALGASSLVAPQATRRAVRHLDRAFDMP